MHPRPASSPIEARTPARRGRAACISLVLPLLVACGSEETGRPGDAAGSETAPRFPDAPLADPDAAAEADAGSQPDGDEGSDASSDDATSPDASVEPDADGGADARDAIASDALDGAPGDDAGSGDAPGAADGTEDAPLDGAPGGDDVGASDVDASDAAADDAGGDLGGTDAGGTADGDDAADDGPPDQDDDGVPDDADPAPNDPTEPGTAEPLTVYAHTSDRLFTFDVTSYAVEPVGDFDWPTDGSHQMTDIAIDSYGVLFGVTFDDLYRCHPQTAVCTHLAELQGSFNGLTVVPSGETDAAVDRLVGITEEGGWYHLEIEDGVVQSTKLGSYGDGYSSSGDAYAIEDVGSYASVDAGGVVSDVLVALDPVTGGVESEVSAIDGHSQVYGLAGWSARAFAFDASGAILAIETSSGSVSTVAETDHTWWGAAVRAQIP